MRSGRNTQLVLMMLLGLQSATARAVGAHEFTFQADVRYVLASTDLHSFMNGGLGLLRFDEADDGLALGGLMLDYAGPIGDQWRAGLTLFATGDNDKNPVDVTEAFIEWRPVPRSAWRWRARAGAFYPPISLENRGVGWQNVYALSSSALNTWIGEELRAIGGEFSVTWAGAGAGRPFDVGVVLGVYGWNDPLGVVIQERGWAIHDRQTALFGRLPDIDGLPAADGSFELFHEIDKRAGYYGGVEWTYLGALTLRALHYDNRGDPAQRNSEEIAWLSRFDAYGLRWELPGDFTFIIQHLQGDTAVGASTDGRGAHVLDYAAGFALISKVFGEQRATLRYDRYDTNTRRGILFFNSWQKGDAWTFAYSIDLYRNWQLIAEGLVNDSRARQRRLQGAAMQAAERSVQVAVRYTFAM